MCPVFLCIPLKGDDPGGVTGLKGRRVSGRCRQGNPPKTTPKGAVNPGGQLLPLPGGREDCVSLPPRGGDVPTPSPGAGRGGLLAVPPAPELRHPTGRPRGRAPRSAGRGEDGSGRGEGGQGCAPPAAPPPLQAPTGAGSEVGGRSGWRRTEPSRPRRLLPGRSRWRGGRRAGGGGGGVVGWWW